MTDDDGTGEAYGSLTARIDLLTPEGSVSGVQPEISADNRSAMATILDDDLSVRITTLDNEASTTISEADNEVRLLLKLSDDINRPLQVNLSYIDNSGLLVMDATTVVTVPAERETYPFTVPIINDSTAAQPIRIFNVSLGSGANYDYGDTFFCDGLLYWMTMSRQ